MSALVSLRNLRVSFDGQAALRGIDLDVAAGEAVGLVGESGCGKSVTWLAALGLLPGKARVTGSATLQGQELLGAAPATLDRVRGGRVAMIFQDPASSLNPVIRIGRQVEEALRLHRGMRGAQARAEAKRLFDQVGIPDAARRLDAWPHELSGGQNQRVMIAIALAGRPELLVADEPTTALDVTIQAQVLGLLADLRARYGMAVVFITHNLGVVAQIADRVAVMYAGEIVEQGPVEAIFANPQHPYTRALFSAIPRLDAAGQALSAIPGRVPPLDSMPAGCRFAARCPQKRAGCEQEQVLAETAPGHAARCHVATGRVFASA